MNKKKEILKKISNKEISHIREIDEKYQLDDDILKLFIDVCLLAHFNCKIPLACIIFLSVSDRNILSVAPRSLYIAP